MSYNKTRTTHRSPAPTPGSRSHTHPEPVRSACQSQGRRTAPGEPGVRPSYKFDARSQCAANTVYEALCTRA
ncbi:hypothetical protein BGW80DRAFT_1300542 [Lactifluus volemus]|nr:hypothetical protein BGW80DRAFT_1300542 [Lactifluus volemus]